MRLTVQEPGDGLDRVLVRARRLIGGSSGALAYAYEPDPDWERHLHERLGVEWPCPARAEFDAVWADTDESLRHAGLPIGRGAYGGWDDADPGLARAVWCLTAHLRPLRVVETGVARGITSRVILERLERNGVGQLWSIDLPALDQTLHAEIGAAIPDRLREQWTYLSGTSRRHLGPLLAELGEIGLFVHDSSHTARNVRFELGCAWPVLGRGAVVVDDIDRNAGFGGFTRVVPGTPSFVAAADDGRSMFGIVLKGF